MAKARLARAGLEARPQFHVISVNGKCEHWRWDSNRADDRDDFFSQRIDTAAIYFKSFILFGCEIITILNVHT